MSNLTIFKQQSTSVATSGKRELSDLAKSMATSAGTTRRIATNTNGTFKRMVNGEQVGNAVRGEINVIIVSALSKVSRIFYSKKFDPNAEPTLPNCWSNLGDKPEPKAPDAQFANCADCPKNIKGSGEGDSKACRYQRRIAILVEGDPTGELYQFNIPAKSLFGKGTGNVHPFESYIKYLLANGESPDNVVTNIRYDDNADGMELLFTPMRNISDSEYEQVKEAQTMPEAKLYTTITVAQTDKVSKAPEKAAEKPKVTRSAEPDEEDGDDTHHAAQEPAKRQSKKAEAAKTEPAKDLADVLQAWSDDE